MPKLLVVLAISYIAISYPFISFHLVNAGATTICDLPLYCWGMWHHVWHWILDFTGVNNSYDSFSTHMYNFWSGFGGNISVLALVGTVYGIYRHNLKGLEKLNLLHMVKTPLTINHRKDKS